MARRRGVAAGVAGGLALALVAAGCKGGHRAPPPPPPEVAAMTACAPALARAATLPPHQRAAAVLRACPVCGPSFEPLLGAQRGRVDIVPVDALMTACNPGCTRAALGTWRTMLTDVVPERGGAGPWRALAEACPAAAPHDQASERFVSAAWFGLGLIAQRTAAAATAATPLPPAVADELARARAAVLLPLPAWTSSGNGAVLPPGHGRPGLPWRALTVTDQAVLLSRLPVARLTDGGVAIEPADARYPGAPVTGDVAAAVAALGPAPTWAERVDDLVVIAPTGAPAARLLAVLAQLGGQPAALAVAVDDPASLWSAAVAAHALTIAPLTGPRLRVDLAAARVAVVDGAGAVRASMPWPVGADPRAQWQPVVAAVRGVGLELCAGAPDGLDVAAVVALLDDAAAAGATGVALAPPGATADAAAQPFDAAALAAALAAAAAKAPQP